MAAAARRPAALAAPTRRLQLVNFVVFQSAWFAAVLGAAHGWPLLGTLCVLAAMAWHVAVAARPRVEATLLAIVCAIGLVIETAVVWQGHIAYASGQPWPQWAPYWMVAMWGLLGIALNVNLRWLKGRPWLAAAIASVAGPASFISGARLGGAVFIDATPALVTMACIWALAMPALMWLSDRFDGVAVPQAADA